MKASDYIANYIASMGVDVVFEMIGGMTTHLLDSIHSLGKTQILTMHHEQAASFAVSGWSQATGKVGVCLATSGPGATNLITGIATCYFDSVPAVFITGQVNRKELSTDKNLRQLGFQETNIVDIVRPITKGAWQVQDVEDVPRILEGAFNLAKSGRYGPVLIDIPMDVQRENIVNFDSTDKVSNEEFLMDINLFENFISSLKKELKNSERPLFLLGGGVVSSGTFDYVGDLLRKTGIPAVYSMMGKGAAAGLAELLPIGFIGSYGNRWANLALKRSDVLIVLGSRLSIRQTGDDVTDFCANKKIFRIDIDSAELSDARVSSDFSINADLKCVMPLMLKNLESCAGTKWLETIREEIEKYPDYLELRECAGINPNAFLKKLGMLSEKAVAFVTDVGAHQVWAAQSLALPLKEQKYLSSGGMGAMGYALPTAIGVSLGAKNKPVVVIVGDGGFQCNIQELQTVVRNKLPIKIVVMNNHSLGLVRQFQERYFDGRYPGTVIGYDAPDFCKIATAYGVDSSSIRDESEIERAIQKIWLEPNIPFLLNVEIDCNTNSFPKMEFGSSLDNMIPRI